MSALTFENFWEQCYWLPFLVWAAVPFLITHPTKTHSETAGLTSKDSVGGRWRNFTLFIDCEIPRWPPLRLFKQKHISTQQVKITMKAKCHPSAAYLLAWFIARIASFISNIAATQTHTMDGYIYPSISKKQRLPRL